ncbi:MAG: hypothetical protein IPP58_00010 [Holophagaceae bacterium]|uniref:Uncharacterized protein n=1 Tax=Candidatus Geothrix skivensis TaxID=2954439 RepID=A0A9D7SDM1_9BACT|nr:hypothetical protein [Candidatus Geothrix skivensis]
MKKGPKSANNPPSGDGVQDLASKPTPVLLTKRAAVAAPDPKAPREKICAECGIHFKVESGQKFYLCPDCYRRSFTYKRKGARKPPGSSPITCATCGPRNTCPSSR